MTHSNLMVIFRDTFTRVYVNNVNIERRFGLLNSQKLGASENVCKRSICHLSLNTIMCDIKHQNSLTLNTRIHCQENSMILIFSNAQHGMLLFSFMSTNATKFVYYNR